MKIAKYLNLIQKYPTYILIRLAGKNIIKIPDKVYLKMVYKIRLNKKLNLKNPQTYNEKLQWLKLYDRKEIYTTMVDKYEAKGYVEKIIGKEYIIPTIQVYDKVEDINFSELPNQFVLKCTHDSSGIVICKDKNKLNIKETKRKLNKALRRNYFYSSREWPYKNVKPRIIAEVFMKEKNNEELKDYKFMCFNGNVKCSFVCSNRNSINGLNVDFFDLEWKKMPFERHYKNSQEVIKKPTNYKLMIELAEKLAKNIPFVRVDFYEVDGKVYFGELTFYPGAGFEEFTPEKYDKILGDWLELPKKED